MFLASGSGNSKFMATPAFSLDSQYDMLRTGSSWMAVYQSFVEQAVAILKFQRCSHAILV